MSQLPSQLQRGNQEPVTVQLDPKSLHSTLKEFFDPLRTNDPRADFFAVYRKESGEFDRDYAQKYDEDLNTSLIFAGLFSAVSSAFITNVQSKLEPDPNESTAAYMQILINTMNSSLFPDVNPSSVAWTGPPPEFVTVQSTLYASLATSLFAAFLAMLGKQWVNRYIRNRGGSVADKSRDRQRKLDGLEKWHFRLVIESIPVMLQFALLLLGSALSLYLWTISRTVAWVTLAFTSFGVASYIFFTLAAMLHYNCLYQTPPSIIIRTLVRYLTHSSSIFAHSLRSFVTPIAGAYSSFVKNLGMVLGRLRAGIRSALREFFRAPGSPNVEHIPLADLDVGSPDPFFGKITIDWEVYKGDARCISWVLDSTTDRDVIFSTVLFAVDMIWYPKIAGTLSPRILADLFLECLLDGRVIPGRLEHANAIGLALASALSIQLSMEPQRKDLQDLRNTVHYYADWVSTSEPTFLPGVAILRIATEIPVRVWRGSFRDWGIFSNASDRLPTTHKLCLSRTILHTIWRWRQADPITPFNLEWIESFCKGLMANSDYIPPALKIHCFLVIAICLGLEVTGIGALFIPNNEEALGATTLIFASQLHAAIAGGATDSRILISVLSALDHLDPFRATNSGLLGFQWITEILNSKYPEGTRHRMASRVVQLLGKEVDAHPPKYFFSNWVLALLDFLSLSEKFYVEGSPPDAGLTALRILLCRQVDGDFGAKLLPILASILLHDHPLQSRSLALEVFHRFMPGWFSQQMGIVSNGNLDKLLRAVDDPFKYPDLPLQHGQPGSATDCEPRMVVVVLVEFASSDLWRNHLNRSNFDSCEEVLSTEEGRRIALVCMLEKATYAWPAFLRTPAKVIAAIRRLEELQCLNTAEVVILWAWTTGTVDVVDRDDWRLIGRETLKFYLPHGIGRLAALKRHIIDDDNTVGAEHLEFLLQDVGYKGSPCRVKRARRPLTKKGQMEKGYLIDLRISQVCQLKRLYHLFGYDRETWEEPVAVEVVDEDIGVSSGQSVTLPVQFMDWACDYP